MLPPASCPGARDALGDQTPICTRCSRLDDPATSSNVHWLNTLEVEPDGKLKPFVVIHADRRESCRNFRAAP